MRPLALLLTLFVAVPILATAQSPSPPPDEAKQFDFLLGQWQADVHVKVSGLAAMIHGTPQLAGAWKAWRALDGRAVEDELRIVDASGNPLSLTRVLRIYAPGEQHWNIVSVDGYRTRVSESTGQFQGGEMHIEARAGETQGESVLTRTRYFDITPDSFRMSQDRSSDGGKTWDEGTLTIDAKRTSASATPG